MNDEIEYLFPNKNDVNTKNSTNDETQIEAIAIDEHGKVEAISIDYNEYRTKLSEFYKLTTLENSIISTYIVDNGICNHTVTLREMTGTQEIKSSKKFNYSSNFTSTFLIPMVEDYNKENEIFNSTIEVLDEDKANFIARTKSNDGLIIMGISVELANQFKDIVTRNDLLVDILDKKTIDEKGISNYLIIILTIIVMVFVIVGFIYLFYYKR